MERKFDLDFFVFGMFLCKYESRPGVMTIEPNKGYV